MTTTTSTTTTPPTSTSTSTSATTTTTKATLNTYEALESAAKALRVQCLAGEALL